MKTLRFLAFFILASLGYPVFSQQASLPCINIYSLDGTSLNAKDIQPAGRSLVIIFWNSDDKKSVEQLKAINEEYENGLKQKNVRIVAICSGYSGAREGIRPLVKGIGLDFEVYIDRNSDLKRAMDVPELPLVMVINPKREVSRYIGYCEVNSELIKGTTDKSLAKVSENP